MVAVPVGEDDRLNRQVADFTHVGENLLCGDGIETGVDDNESVVADDHRNRLHGVAGEGVDIIRHLHHILAELIAALGEQLGGFGFGVSESGGQ